MLKIMFNREIFGKHCKRKAFSEMYQSQIRTFDLVWQSQETEKIFYDGYLYLSKFKLWYNGCFDEDVPEFFETNITNNILHPTGRVKDILRYQCCQFSPNFPNKECIFMLTSTSRLLCYALAKPSWDLIYDIFLGDRMGFSKLFFSHQNEIFVVKSRRYPNLEEPNVVFYFALFSVPPLKFIGVLTILESIFGKALDANINNDILFVFTGNYVKLFDFDNMMKTSLIFNVNIGDSLPRDVFGSYYGSDVLNDTITIACEPYGLPANIMLNEDPVILYQIPSKSISELAFGGFPWCCLAQFDNTLKLFNLEDQREYVFEQPTLCHDMSIDERPAFFHSDNSGQIILVNQDNISYYAVQNAKDKKVKPHIVINFSVCDDKHKPSISEPQFSKFGRRIKTVQRRGVVPVSTEIVHSVDYCLDSNLIAVLYTDKTLSKYFVGVYDNFNGKKIQAFSLKFDATKSENHNWSIYIDGLVVLCILGYIVHSRKQCVMYKLQ